MNPSLRKSVRRRAHFRCEYCGLTETFSPVLPLHVEHIVARKHGGATHLSNLALACFHCNLHKQTDLVGIDPLTRKRSALFHPRRHRWPRHFAWDGLMLIGKTAIGRTTVAVLAMNDEDMLDLRTTLLEEGAFPW
jgi:HNH endonuclease